MSKIADSRARTFIRSQINAIGDERRFLQERVFKAFDRGDEATFSVLVDARSVLEKEIDRLEEEYLAVGRQPTPIPELDAYFQL